MASKSIDTLVILAEECAEVTQDVCKMLRFKNSINPITGVNNLDKLTTELGHLQAMIELCIKNCYVCEESLEKAKLAKFEKLKTWSNIME